MAQFLPSSDFFTTSGIPYGAGLGLYFRCMPWGATETGTGLNLRCQYGDLFNGYSANPSTGQGGAAFAATGTTAFDDRLAFAVYRNGVFSDGEAVNFPRHALAFGITLSGFSYAAVIGRVQGGTVFQQVGGDEGDQHVQNVDCYMFLHTNGGGLRELRLLRVNAGTVTQLAVTPVPAPDGIPPDDPFEGFGPTRMKLEITGSSPVNIKCKRNRPGIGTPVEELIFDFNDAAANRIQTVGRWGFGSMVAHTSSSSQNAIVHSRFQTRAYGPSNILLDDEFARVRHGVSRRITPGPGLPDGFSLMSLYAGDAHGTRDNPPHYNNLLQDTTGARAVMGTALPQGTGVNFYGWNLFQRRADSLSQHRSANMTHVTTGADPPRVFGIHLRGTFNTNQLAGDRPNGKGGYMAAVVYDSAATFPFLLEIRAFTPSPLIGYTYDVIGSADLGPLGAAPGFTFELDFEVQNLDVGSTTGGLPALRVKFNAATVNLTNLDPNVEFDGEWLTDYRTGAAREGLIEAFYFFADADTAVPSVHLNSWEFKDPSIPPTVVNPDDLVSVALPGEADGKFGLLEISPSYPVRIINADQVRRVVLEQGHVSISPRHGRNRRSWGIDLRNMSFAKRIALSDFFSDHNGSEIPFDWVPPGDKQLCVHLAEDSYQYTFVRPDNEAAEIVLEEIFENA